MDHELLNKGAAALKPAPKRRQRKAKPVRIVGIGASAGGLEAFTELLRHLPTDSGVAYVLVQHLDPTHRSLLSELLARVTTLPVREIKQNARVEPNQIYVIPPNCDLGVERGLLKLSPRKKNGGPARSIDHFLKSLAEDQKDKAIAVILSGAGSDGANGLKAVKATGGLTFAQDEQTAKYNSMPRSAAATGCVDFVLSPEKIAEEIARFIRQPDATKGRAAANARRRKAKTEGVARWAQRATTNAWPAPPADLNLRKILLQLRVKTGVDFALYKMSTIRRRLARRMAANKIKTLEGYSRFLREHSHELEALYQDCLINVTSFFRNPSSFEVLKRKIFPRLVRNHSGADALRIWVAGCATGQEAYSIAIAYAEFLEQSPVQVPLQIFATDVNASVLERARAARYPKAQLDGMPVKRLNRFFTADDGHYRVQKLIRDMVVFAQHNLLTDPPFTKVDLITCRNVLIYFEPALQQRILPTFHYALKPNGFLWLGTSESIGQFTALFEPVEKSHRMYGRKPAASWLRLDRPPLIPTTSRMASSFSAASRPAEFNVVDAQKEADRLTLAKYTPPSVLVNEDLDVLQFRGELDAYLALPSGKANFNLLKMARDGLSAALQRALQKARKDNRVVREKRVPFGGRGKVVNLEIVPLKHLKARCYLIFFERVRRSVSGRPASAEAAASSKGAALPSAETRQEVAELREQLASIQEEHETAVEELQASNEEVQSSNEELQSLNEELETSNEELESANEELTTLNEELATRNTELRESERRLREQAQLLEMAPVIARSTKDRIIIWSGGAEAMYGFTKEEAIGQSAHILLNTHFHEPLERIQAKLLRDDHWEGEVEHRRKDGRSVHVFAKWVVHRDNERKVRAVLEVNTDITARKEAEKALRASEEFNRSILENNPDCIKVLDAAGRVMFVNAGASNAMEMEEIASRLNIYWPSFWPAKGREQAEEAMRTAFTGKVARFRGACPTAKGTHKWWDVAVSPIFGPDGKPEKLLVARRDITDHVHAEEQLSQYAGDLEKRVEERTTVLRQIIGELEAFSYSVSHDLRTPLRAMEGYARALLHECADALTEQHRGYLERIIRGARRLDRMTLDVLAYSRLSRTEFTPQCVELDKLVRDIIEQYPQFQSVKSQIAVEGPLLRVLGHEAFLTQCVSNLIGNALKFVAPGTTPHVRIWTESHDGKVRLFVQDNGIGIAPEHRARVFEIFGRVHADKQYEGSGIGLAVVKRAAERMRGAVDFTSTPGEGTQFWIELPVAPD